MGEEEQTRLMRVHFHDFPPDEDEIWHPSSFDSFYQFNDMVRPISQAMQDADCKYVGPGRIVCVAWRRPRSDCLEYYDAVVHQVSRSKHRVVSGQERCECRFEVMWRQGPLKQRKQVVTCGDICLLALGDIEDNPVIRDFIKMIAKASTPCQQSPQKLRQPCS